MKKLSKTQTWAIALWVITALTAFATVMEKSRTLIIVALFLAVFGYLLWIWDADVPESECENLEDEK